MLLETKSNKLTEEAKKIKEGLIKMSLNEDTIEFMDSNTLEMMQASLRFFDASIEYMEVQSRAIDEMNRKLDKLLAK